MLNATKVVEPTDLSLDDIKRIESEARQLRDQAIADAIGRAAVFSSAASVLKGWYRQLKALAGRGAGTFHGPKAYH